MKITNKEYLKFLSNIDLESYRLRFRPYMSVEENLPKFLEAATAELAAGADTAAIKV